MSGTCTEPHVITSVHLVPLNQLVGAGPEAVVVLPICELAGFDVGERIVLIDMKTGRIWK